MTTKFQRFVVRKLTDIGFKISSLEEQCRRLCRKLNIVQDRLEKITVPGEIENEDILDNVMKIFPIDDIEDLENFEKSVIAGEINRNNVVSI